MPDGLYEHDALAWAEKQAALLRRLAAGERLNEKVDWPNVIEEVQDVGLSELRACQSLLQQALVHLLKLHAWPDSPAASHWRGEIIGFLADAQRRFTPSMRQRIELENIYARALRQVRAGVPNGEAQPTLPGTCPFTPSELLAEELDAEGLCAQLARG